MIDLDAFEERLQRGWLDSPAGGEVFDWDAAGVDGPGEVLALIRAVRAAVAYRDADPMNCAYCGGNEATGGHERWCNVDTEQSSAALDAALGPFRPEAA